MRSRLSTSLQLLKKHTMPFTQAIFERAPGHKLEKNWALYVDTERLLSIIIAQKKLPVVSFQDASMFWQSEIAPDNQDELSTVTPGHYTVLVTARVSVGEVDCDACIFICENEKIADCNHVISFHHKAPAPVLPWPECSTSIIELPPDFISTVKCGLQQAQVSLLRHIRENHPAITEMIA